MDKTVHEARIPEWYLETFQAVQHIDGGLRSVEFQLREAIEIKTLDERVRTQMQGFLNALHGIKGSLVLVDMTAREVLDQILTEAA